MITQNRPAQFLIATVCILLLPGCAKKASEEVDFGVFKNSVYENEYFGFKVTIPSTWSVQDQRARQQLAEQGTKMLAGDDKGMKAMLKASELQTITLLAAFQHPVGTPVAFNPSITSVAERVRDLPGIKQGKDYLFHAKKMLESGKMKFEFPKEISTEKLGGLDFDVLYASLTVGPTTVQQKYYAIIKKGYALNFIVSFTSKDEESALQTILNSISFK